MTSPATTVPTTPTPPAPLREEAFDDIPREDWERLVGLTTAATPFARWTFHRAWWDAYGQTAEPHYLVCGHDPVTAIVPLMGRRVASLPPATLFYAASYHADYATALMGTNDIESVASALTDELARRFSEGTAAALDLRRIRPADEFAAVLEERALALAADRDWLVRREQEDVSPVVELVSDWNQQLSGLGKKARHEIRRKVRRAQRAGPVQFRYLPLDSSAADGFIRLHQARWGSNGLFAATDDGDRSRVFLHRLVELEGELGAGARFHLGDVTIDDRVAYALAGFSEGGTTYFYNAGLDPDCLDLSPGVVGTAAYLRERGEAGDTTFDFLRGNEPYKYAWGASDTSIDRIVIEPATPA
jgi:CelD/BcsL family acetyltransferase involved in cellulose biosynthesis